MVTDVIINPGTATTVVTLAKAKKHLRVDADFTDEDDLIQDYIDGGVVNAENYIGGHIVDKEMIFKLNQFDSPFIFEAFPLKEVTSVKYFDEANDLQTLATDKYKLTRQNSKVNQLRFIGDLPAIYDRLDAVEISVSVGMETIDKPIQQAVLLMVADMYERREDRGETLSTQAMSLLRPYKKF